MKLSIVVPVFNEANNVTEFYNRIKNALNGLVSDYEIIFVDDGSNDNSFDVICSLHTINPQVKVIRFSRNFGHHIALSAGLDFAQGEAVAFMDGDLQHPPEAIQKFLEKIQDGYDVVYAVHPEKKHGILKRLASTIFSFVINHLTQEPIFISSNVFQVMRRSVVEVLKTFPERNRYFLGLVSWVGFKQTGVIVRHEKRYSGKTKYTFSKLFQLAFDAVFSFSLRPLRLATLISVIMFCFSVLLGSYYLFIKFVYGIPFPGFASLIVAILFISGLQFLFLGIIGEYIGRTYVETKHRPLYIIRDKVF